MHWPKLPISNQHQFEIVIRVVGKFDNWKSVWRLQVSFIKNFRDGWLARNDWNLEIKEWKLRKRLQFRLKTFIWGQLYPRRASRPRLVKINARINDQSKQINRRQWAVWRGKTKIVKWTCPKIWFLPDN